MGTISTGVVSLQSIRSTFGLIGTVDVSQFHNVPSGGPIYYRGEQHQPDVYPIRSVKSISMSELRGKSFPLNNISIELRGRDGSESVTLQTISASSTVERYTNYILPTTFVKFNMPATQNGETVSALSIRFNNDSAARDAYSNQSIVVNGMEQLHPTRVRDTLSYYANGDGPRRLSVILLYMAWTATYIVDFFPATSVQGLGYYPVST